MPKNKPLLTPSSNSNCLPLNTQRPDIMKRDIYALFTTIVLLLAIAFSVFLVISDNAIPFTTQARVKTSVIEVVPEVQGYISEVMVKEGQTVTIGTPLLKIDPTDYKIAQKKAQANVMHAESQSQQAQNHYERVQSLYQSKSVSKASLDEAKSATQSAKASLLAAQSDAEAAQRNLNNTLVVAKQSGAVTNLTYRVGMRISSASPVLHLIDEDNLWLDADFTEKGLAALRDNQAVNIVFDAQPNEVYSGHIFAIDSAISAGISDPSQLAQITDESRWIRAQQKARVRIQLEKAPEHIIAGSRASVMMDDEGHVSDVWMTLLSWMRYLY
jgi:RND family efflux transporter MFP subunit